MNNNRSRSTLFLMEQLIVIATFAVCAAACIKILTASYFMATATRDTSNAIRIAESSAECYKAVSGDIAKTAQIMGGTTAGIRGSETAVVYFDGHWQVCGEEEAAYTLKIVSERRAGLAAGTLSVERSDGGEILAFPVAAR